VSRGGLLRRESRALLLLAGPIVAAQLGQVGMNTMDTIMVGPLGAEALAAVGLGAALHTAMLIISVGLLLGMSPLVSQAFGAGRRRRCRVVLVQGLWLAAAISVPVVWINLEGQALSLRVGQGAELSALAGGYMSALAPGVVPALLFIVFRQFLEGMSIAKPAMVITFLGLAVNFVANYVLIYGVEGYVPALGVVGCGWATTIVRTAMIVAMAAYVIRRPDLHPFRGVAFLPRWPILVRVIAIGAPIGVQLGLEVGLFTFAAVMMGWLGTVELGSHQVTINIASTTFMVALGVSLAGCVRVGRNIGGRDTDGARSAAVATYLWTFGFMALCALLFVSVPTFLVGLYTGDREILALAGKLLLVAALFQVFDGAQVAGLNVLRGAADTRVPMLLAALAYWGVGVPVAFYLGFRTELGPVGIWLGMCAGLAAAALLLGWRVYRLLWGARFRPVI